MLGFILKKFAPNPDPSKFRIRTEPVPVTPPPAGVLERLAARHDKMSDNPEEFKGIRTGHAMMAERYSHADKEFTR